MVRVLGRKVGRGTREESEEMDRKRVVCSPDGTKAGEAMKARGALIQQCFIDLGKAQTCRAPRYYCRCTSRRKIDKKWTWKKALWFSAGPRSISLVPPVPLVPYTQLVPGRPATFFSLTFSHFLKV